MKSKQIEFHLLRIESEHVIGSLESTTKLQIYNNNYQYS